MQTSAPTLPVGSRPMTDRRTWRRSLRSLPSLTRQLTLSEIREVHYARQWLLDPTVSDFADIVSSGRYAPLPDGQNLFHRLGDPVNEANIKFLSDDGH